MKNTILDISKFRREGLFLVFPDSTQIEFTRENIERLADEYWSDPKKIPPDVRKAIDFQPCDHCPQKGKDVLCKALRPLLPYVENVDCYVSYDNVTAVFRGEDTPILHLLHTTMQQALKYIAILCMIYYCEMSERYEDYFRDVIPMMNAKDISSRVYANIYMIHEGRKDEIAQVISEFKKEVFESTQCLLKRLRMICKNDAFLNAFVNTNSIMEYLDFKTFEDA